MRDVTNSAAGGIEEGEFRGSYDVSLSLNPIPLPPAAWPGLLTLAGVGAACWARRRKKG